MPVTLKSLRTKDYSEAPQTLGEHLKKRRRILGLLQREATLQMGILTETFANWENGKTEPVAAQFRPVVEFLGYDPTPEARTLGERLEAKRRGLGATFSQVASYLGWDEGSLRRYLRGQWRLSQERADAIEQFLALDQVKGAVVLVLPHRRR